jgi:hypothetical protein
VAVNQHRGMFRIKEKRPKLVRSFGSFRALGGTRTPNLLIRSQSVTLFCY